jgi:ubiquinone/menaquinone biosynthesis C-methylase UbiE
VKEGKNSIGNKLSGKGREHIPNVAFQLMAFIMKLMDILGNHSNRNFKSLCLKPGQVVIDYGCGPARYICNASAAVGKSGKVIAVDIHPLAIAIVKRKIHQYSLTNVETVLAEGYATGLPDHIADVIYALDMFHMIENTHDFLRELCRLVKTDGCLILEDGHQSRHETIKKINQSGYWKLIEETEHHVKCIPLMEK